ncbi:MAG: hypothetical protein PF503_16265 [Desulfobacula sp.]|nr:hypothetical protein [Desulfobacula sp.]
MTTDPGNSVSGWQVAKQEFKAELDNRTATVTTQADVTLDALKVFTEVASGYNDATSLSILFHSWNKLRKAQVVLEEEFDILTGKYGTAYEGIIQNVQKSVPNQINGWLAKAKKQGKHNTTEVREAVNNYEQTVNLSLSSGRKLSVLEESARIHITDSVMVGLQQADTQKVGREITGAMNFALEQGQKKAFILDQAGRKALGDAAASFEFYNTQIDRLQDPSDPAWREITKEKNQSKWQPHFAETSFYAEGKSDVVFVRDRIGHFRIQRGTNNPTALIQSQFKISRAVASGAVEVMAAVAGVSGVPGVSAGVDKLKETVSGAPGETDPGTTEADDVIDEADITEDAQRNSEVSVSRRNRTALLNALTQLHAEVAKSRSTQVDTTLFDRIKAMLNAHKLRFPQPTTP